MSGSTDQDAATAMDAGVRSDGAPQYSFALTTYQGAATIREFHQRLTTTMAGMDRTYELIFVDDGSTDDTYEQLEALFESDPHIACIVKFMRNAGQMNALTAALSFCRGERVVVLDSDLELAPEDFPDLAVRSEEGYDLVSAYRLNRSQSVARRAGSFVFNLLMRRLSRLKFRDFGCTFKILDGRIVHAFDLGPNCPVNVTAILGSAQTYSEVPVRQHPRAHGASGWTLWRLFAVFVERIITTSPAPFHLLGIVCMVAAALMIAANAAVVLGLMPRWSDETQFWVLVNMQAAAFIVLAAFLAVAGDLIARIFLTLNNGPSYIIRSMRTRRSHHTD